MPRTGLTCEEFVNLKLRPPASADPAFHSAAETMAAELFPMTLLQASAHLRGRGYDSRPEMLELLVRNKVVNPTRPDAWSQLDVDAAADHFEDGSIYTPYAAMCQTLGCGYADFLRPLREAAEIASAKYRRRIPEDDQLFVMHRVPPRGVTGSDGSPSIQPAVLSFTLCDDIQERLERGEEV